MTPSRFKTIISGALKSWRLDMELTYEMDGFSCLISDKSGLCVKIVFEEQPSVIYGEFPRLAAKSGYIRQ
jgi:hypothetical protein